MKKRFIIYLTCLVIIIFGSLAIYLKKDNESSSLTNIKLAEVTHSVFYTPLYVAIENGYFEDEGIKIDLILTPGADKVSAAVLSGDANIGFAGAESAIYVYQAKEKDYLQIFGGLTKRDGQFIVSRKPIKDFKLEDLIDKEIVVGRSTGMPALNFINSLDNAGVNVNKIKINNSIDFASLSGAFIGGTGDFVNLFEPNATLLESQGYGHIVASVGKLSGEVPYTTFYAKKSYIENNSEILKKFNNAIATALNYVKNNDSKKIAETIIKQFPDTKINDLKIMIERYKTADSWLDDPYISEELFNNLEKFLIKFELINSKTSYVNLVNNIYE